MRSLLRVRLGLFAGSGLAATGVASAAALSLPKPEDPHGVSSRRTNPALAHTSGSDDPHLWLEQIEGEDALAWCRQRNAHAVAAVGEPTESPTYHKILAIADSQDKIPYVGQIGESDDEGAAVLYNFWQDADHVRGVWRRTSMASYRTPTPTWEEVLSLDALNAAEGRGEGDEFVWHGEDVLDEGPGKAQWDRALLFLSPGGTDASIVREFDLRTKTFVPSADGGFATLTAEKCDIGFRRRDEVLIGTNFDGSGDALTTSGYPRVVKSWKRGTPLSEAVTVFQVEKGDISGAQYCYHDRGSVHEFQLRSPSFYTTEQWHRTPDLTKAAHEDTTPFTRVPVPDDASIGTFGDQATLMLRSEWAPPKAPRADTYPAGSLLVAPLKDVLQSDWSKAQALFVPDESTSLRAASPFTPLSSQ
jgi:prolyl oligopeptidase